MKRKNALKRIYRGKLPWLYLIAAAILLPFMLELGLADTQDKITIEQFEISGSVSAQTVETGRKREDIELPESIPAIVPLKEEVNLSAFKQEEPPLEEDKVNQLQFQLVKEKYVAPENAEELYQAGEMVLYEFDKAADGTVEHRVYGSLEGGEKSWFVCDAKGSIEKQIVNIPVTWEGDFDGEKSGSYQLTAQWENYIYEGEHPSYSITVESAPGNKEEESKAAEEQKVPEDNLEIPTGKALQPTTWVPVNYTENGIPIIDFLKNLVLINENDGEMLGYDTLQDAMKAVGTSAKAYQIIFVKSSYAVTAADLEALQNNGKKSKKLTFTSTYYDGNQEMKATVSSPADHWLLPANTEFKDIRLDVASGAVNFIANGHKLIMGNGIENSGSGVIDVYGGGSATYKGDSNVNLLSGTYRNVFGGNYAGTMTGRVSLNISGKAVVSVLYGSSNDATQVGSVQINIDGADGAKVSSVYGAGQGTNGLLSSSSLVNIVLKDMQGIVMVDDATRNNGKGNTLIEGNVQVTGNILSKSMLDIGENSQLSAEGTLTLHSMTLNTGARLTKTGAGVNTISGLLKVTGANARISLYKANDTSAPVKLSLQSLDASEVLTLAYTNGVKGQNNDVLLTFSDANNVSNYFNKDIASNAVLHLERSGANLILSSAAVPTPSYYQKTAVSGVYSYEDIGGSNNDYPVYYRKIDPKDGTWHACNADGSNMNLAPVDHQQEHPQPNATTQKSVSFGLLQDNMIIYEEFGKYRMNVITSSAKKKKTPDYSEGTWINEGNKGKSNATKDVLKQTTPTSKIHKAILIMSTVDTESQSLVNQPMTLEGPKGGKILSNGYLPEGFTSMSGGMGTLSSDKPCVIRNIRNGIMMLTDVTDFVKEQGYGTYYGIDLVGGATVKVPDFGTNWRILVFEEDPNLQNSTFTRWAVGPRLIPSGQSLELNLDLNGLTTPISGDFKGQILLGGQSGDVGGAGEVRIYPNRNDTTQSYPFGADDPATSVVERPTTGAAQDIVDVDGIRNRSSSGFQSTQSTVKGDGQDLGLFNVTTKQNTGWQTKGGHNLYFKNKSPGIRMLVTMTGTRAYTPDLLAISTEVQLPEFSAEIMHTDIELLEGVDVAAGQTVHVRAGAINVTGSTANYTGTANTKAVIEVDPSLSDVREIMGIFSKFDQDSEIYTDYEVTGIYDPVEDIITFDFGQDMEDIPLFNQRGDKISISFTCTTSKEPKNNITNVIKVNASNAVNGVGEQVDLGVNEYARSEDRFNTFEMPVLISKTGIVKEVEGKGSLAKPVYVESDEIYTYKITLSNNSENTVNGLTVQDVIPAGLELITTEGSYTSGMIYEIDANTQRTTVRWENQKVEVSGSQEKKEYLFQVRVVTPMLYKNTAQLIFEESNDPVDSNTVYHQGHGIAKVRLKKVIENYQPDLEDHVFFLKLTNGVETEVVLSHDEISPYIKLAMTPQMLSSGVSFDVSEIVPLEYDPNYKVSLQAESGSTGTAPAINDRRITVYPDNLVTITITNTFEHKPYFKGRDFEQNLFKP